MSAPGVVQGRSRYSGFCSLIKAIATGRRGSRDLTFEEAHAATWALLTGEATRAQAGAFLVAMRVKGESPEELAGAASALREATAPLAAVTDRPLVVSAGAYDGVARAPALSLAAGVVAAACGAGVVLHCGDTPGPKYATTPADVLAALGGPTEPALEQSRRMLERAGVALVHTAVGLPGWRALAEIRDEIGVRGPLHSAEKLIDFFGARRFIVGHTHSCYSERLVGALELLGAERAIAVRGIEGSDVLRPGHPFAFELHGEIMLPERPGARLDGRGGSRASADATRRVISGDGPDAVEHAVTLTAGLQLYAADLARDPAQGTAAARTAIAHGRAATTLDALLHAAHSTG